MNDPEEKFVQECTRNGCRPFGPLTPPLALSDIEDWHPARWGAKSPMQTIHIRRRVKPPSPNGTERARQGPEGDLSPLLAGAATAVGGFGALLALVDAESPLRGPCTLFFLLAAPATAVWAALRGLEPFGRLLTAVAGAVVLDMLVAQGMLAVHRWSWRGGIIAVTVISCLLLLVSCVTVKPTKR
ncbi:MULTISPECIES: hypothetical protein [Streptomyces]|uniref:hypothetical protein n=1 Tax=Streptomyces TaxID=1883 RepID=UPI00201CBC36|nr:hypothetical protein [Streptomyces panaciradicis]MCL6671314.1 hypothetical protein [Streptomyces panaciradicis]